MTLLRTIGIVGSISGFTLLAACSTMPDGGGSDLAGIQGMNSIEAFDVMVERGFRNVDSTSSGNTQYGIFYKASTGVCAQLTMANTRVLDVRDVQTHPNCR